MTVFPNEIPSRPLTEAEVDEAMTILADLDELAQRYSEVTTGRSLISDWYARSHIDTWATVYGNLADSNATMRAVIDSGHTPSVFGDDRWHEATYYAFQDEVRLAVHELGLWIEDEDIEVAE